MKKIICLLIVVLSVLCLTACVEVESVKGNETSGRSMFVEVEATVSWRIVYHKETKVMYAVSLGSYNIGTFTLLVDENGDPLLWQGD